MKHTGRTTKVRGSKVVTVYNPENDMYFLETSGDVWYQTWAESRQEAMEVHVDECKLLRTMDDIFIGQPKLKVKYLNRRRKC